MYRENLITGSEVLKVLRNRAILFNRAVVDVVESSWSQAQSCWAKQGEVAMLCLWIEDGTCYAELKLWLRCASWGAWQAPFFWERKTLITLATVTPRHLIVSTLVIEAKNNFIVVSCLGFYWRGEGREGLLSFVQKTKNKKKWSLLMLSLLLWLQAF